MYYLENLENKTQTSYSEKEHCSGVEYSRRGPYGKQYSDEGHKPSRKYQVERKSTHREPIFLSLLLINT
jgi:hypothetical protein